MASKIKLCKEKQCMNAQTTVGYCRLHYLKNRKNIHLQKKEKAAKSLESYINNVLRNDPDHRVKKQTFSEVESDLEFTQENDTGLYIRDEFDSVLENLEGREDLDRLIENIKVDETF